ncbi:hypothetical protein [Rhizobium sp. BIGb0125]|uniref:hypothetical protein n=1 Tax=Rhizobium sp. BIGb0125 TaxID=2940618 RepID=UPI00386566CE
MPFDMGDGIAHIVTRNILAVVELVVMEVSPDQLREKFFDARRDGRMLLAIMKSTVPKLSDADFAKSQIG